MRVLLIEDDSATAQSIELMLKSENFNVYVTDLGEEHGHRVPWVVESTCVQIAARHADPPHHHAIRPGPKEPRPTPQQHSRRIQGIRNITA